MAPELICNKSYQGHVVDLFSLGVILFVMYVGRPPFNVADQNDDLYKIILDNEFDYFWQVHSQDKTEGFFTEDFKNLIWLML